MDTNIFFDKNNIPNNDNLKESLGDTYNLWILIKEYVILKYPNALEEWNFPSAKYGWSFRIKDKKRAILYMLPKEKFFKVAFVFGQKATDIIMKSEVSKEIRQELDSARVYVEGRGIRLEVKDETFINDIKELINIKIAN